jgi:hypothetical protein
LGLWSSKVERGVEKFREVELANQRLVNLPKAGEFEVVEKNLNRLNR